MRDSACGKRDEERVRKCIYKERSCIRVECLKEGETDVKVSGVFFLLWERVEICGKTGKGKVTSLCVCVCVCVFVCVCVHLLFNDYYQT